MSNGFFGRLARKWWLMLALGIVIGMAAGCSQESTKTPSVPATTPAPYLMTVDESSNGKEVKIAPNGALQVVLDSNVTTGFKWELTSISDSKVVEKVSNTYETLKQKRKEGEPPLPGAGGTEFWSFKALKKGTANISMEYSQPWAGGTKGAEKFRLTVVVE
ncbi:MAG: protease inhibitor I42 family protein [Chloroflexi bacterium]|nr:protease inhibitor I42 family protein [Chloroflexota bacterium]